MSTTNKPALDPELPCSQNPDLWFATRSEAVALAVEGCSRCPLQRECRSWAIATDEQHGVWGGTTAEERESYRTAPAARREPHARRQVAA